MKWKTFGTVTLSPLPKSARILLALIACSLLLPIEAKGAAAKEGLSAMVYYKWVYPTDDDEYNEFSFDRIYITYEKQLWDGVKVKLVTDIKNVTTIKSIYEDGKIKTDNIWAPQQKNAYIDYKTGAGNLLIGMQGMNLFNVIKDNWGYRFLAKSSMNELKWASSADLGLGYKVTVAKKAHIHFTVTNGTGFDNKESDKFKKFAAQVVYGTKKLGMKPGFNVGVAGTFEPYEYSDTTNAAVTVVALFGAFATKSLRFGGEFDREMDLGEGQPDRDIAAVYADLRVRIIPGLNLNIFGRVERYDENLGVKGDAEINCILGLKIFPIAAFNIAPNIRYCLPETGESGITAFQLNFEFKY